MNHYIASFVNKLNLSLTYFRQTYEELIHSIKNKRDFSSVIVPVAQYVQRHSMVVLFIILLICILLSNLLLNIFFILLLVDSIFSSLFILLNTSLKKYSIKLSTNVLILFILYFNPLHTLITLLLCFIFFTQYSQIIKNVFIDSIEIVFPVIFTNINFLQKIYPDYKFLPKSQRKN
jgi:hypothetical protein